MNMNMSIQDILRMRAVEGKTYEAIGKLQHPPVSRQAIQQRLARHSASKIAVLDRAERPLVPKRRWFEALLDRFLTRR